MRYITAVLLLAATASAQMPTTIGRQYEGRNVQLLVVEERTSTTIHVRPTSCNVSAAEVSLRTADGLHTEVARFDDCTTPVRLTFKTGWRASEIRVSELVRSSSYTLPAVSR